MKDFEPFCEDYLAKWETQSMVRSKPRYHLESDMAGEDLFPLALQPLARHPDVVAKGEDAVRAILVRTCYKWMEDVALIETYNVGPLCAFLANGDHAVSVPLKARQVALTVLTDEAYHAYVAREFMERVVQITGIEPEEDIGTYGLSNALAWAEDNVPADVLPLFKLTVLCFAENTNTYEILGMTKETKESNPFNIVLKEHLGDESRHAVYFQNLMAHIWDQIDEDMKQAIGKGLPGFFEKFFYDFAPYADYYRKLLTGIGFGEEEIKSIFKSAPPPPKGPAQVALNVKRVFERADMIRHPAMAEVLALLKLDTPQ